MEQNHPRPVLPTGGPQPVHFFEHTLPPAYEFGNSTSSSDSFRTQAPLPYHLPSNYYMGTPHQPGSWDTPVIPNDLRQDGNNGRSKMNPTSPAWIPGGLPPLPPPVRLPPLPPITPGLPQNAQHSFGANTFGGPVPPLNGSYPQPAGPYSGVPNPHFFQPPDPTMHNFASNGHALNQHFNSGHMEGNYLNHYRSSMPMNANGPLVTSKGYNYHPIAPQGFEPYQPAANNFAGTYANTPRHYNPNGPYGMNKPPNAGFNSNSQNTPYPGKSEISYPHQNMVNKTSTPSTTTAKPVDISSRFRQHETFKIRAAANAEKQMAMMGISDEKAQEKVDGPTPVSKHPAGTFSSEPRPTAETPLLRSRRGQTISSAVSDPARKTSKAWSVEETPSEKYTENSNGSNGNGSSTGLSLSPPKMRSLVAGNGNGASTLTPINEADPFVGGQGQLVPFNGGHDPLTANGSQSLVPYLVGDKSMSTQLRQLTQNGTTKPPVEVALDQKNLPFSESCRLARPSKAGVIRIRNIPYSVTRTEVLAFLGRNARLLNENEAEPIHIIMERVTSKTLDCYAEFTSLTEAINAVERYEIHRSGGRGGKLGQRHVEIELSSQEALMKELFPKAKNVKWQGARPIIYPSDPEDQYNSGFQGFTSREEMVMLVKHVESPQRSPFSKDCPQRPFECLVSTLTKYPWYMVDHITIDERNRIHHATKELVALLVNHIERYPEDLCLTPQLLKRVWKAALRCPGFTPAMKDDIVYLCRIDDDTARLYGVPPYAPYWKYLWTIGAKPNVPDDLLLWYITIIREHTQPKTQLSLAEQAAREDPDCNAVKLFGDLEKHIQYGKDFSEQTLGVVARAEWAAIEKVLREALE